MSEPYNENGTDTFLADSTNGIAAHIRVKLLSNRRIAPAGESEQEIGVTRIKTKDHLEPCEVRLVNASGSVEVRLSGTVEAGDVIKRQAAGEAGPGGGGANYAIAGAPGGDGDVIPVYPI